MSELITDFPVVALVGCTLPPWAEARISSDEPDILCICTKDQENFKHVDFSRPHSQEVVQIACDNLVGSILADEFGHEQIIRSYRAEAQAMVWNQPLPDWVEKIHARKAELEAGWKKTSREA